MNRAVVGFAGMTHLGLISAAAVASQGFEVVCFDVDEALVKRLRRIEFPISEPELDEMVRSNGTRQRFTADISQLRGCDVVYIALDVPTDDEGCSDTTSLVALIDKVTAALSSDATLVILSQVEPGFTRKLVAPPLERRYYQVETLVFGRAVERATRPERYIVGCADPGRPLPAKYRAVLEAFDCPILPMRYESAELAKISINFCLVASVSAANTLAELSEQIGADWREIVPALRLDRRIGPHAYLNPGLGISGGNLERDLRTVLSLGRQRATELSVVEAWLRNSQHRKDWTWRTLRDAVLFDNPAAVVAVLGLAYKENTHSTKNSPSLRLLSHLQGRTVKIHDPLVPGRVAPFAHACATAMECAHGADVLVLVTPWPEYRELSLESLARDMRGRVIIDPYHLLDGQDASALGFIYYGLGHPPLSPKNLSACLFT
jgi:UDPglucose 6-dehydrogenase